MYRCGAPERYRPRYPNPERAPRKARIRTPKSVWRARRQHAQQNEHADGRNTSAICYTVVLLFIYPKQTNSCISRAFPLRPRRVIVSK